MTSPKGVRPTRSYRLILARMMGLSAVGLLGVGTAYPHDSIRPELNAWFQSLKNKAGQPYCDIEDGQPAEVDWDIAKGGYKVLLRHPHRPTEPGQWFDVPYSVVINQPNLSGIAMVWWHPLYDEDGKMTPCGAASFRDREDDLAEQALAPLSALRGPLADLSEAAPDVGI